MSVTRDSNQLPTQWQAAFFKFRGSLAASAQARDCDSDPAPRHPAARPTENNPNAAPDHHAVTADRPGASAQPCQALAANGDCPG